MAMMSENTRWMCRTVDAESPPALSSPTHAATSEVATDDSR